METEPTLISFDKYANDPVLNILRDSRDLILDESRWQQGMMSNVGESVRLIKSPEATCFCARGALIRVSDVPVDASSYGLTSNLLGASPEPLRIAVNLLNRAASKFFGKGRPIDIIEVNDRLGHLPTLRCFDDAIAQRILDLTKVENNV